jgi:hypothetical protein
MADFADHRRVTSARLVVLGCSWALVAACAVDSGTPPPPAPLAPLPPAAMVDTDRFADAARCAQCHLADATASALHDAAGRDVSPVRLWRATMMALAARDPYYLAVFAEELARRPSAPAVIEAACTRCHAPAGSEELADHQQHLTFADLTTATTPAALIGREGVTCTLCHQIAADGLGAAATMSGGFKVGFGRQIFGVYDRPITDPMMFFVRYTPTGGTHVADGGLCATCHVVAVQPLDDAGQPVGAKVFEQATYLEWQAAATATTKTCQACHVPTVDEDGAAIATRAARYPDTTTARQPFGRHVFVGGNAYMLRLLAANLPWVGADVSAADLEAQAVRSERHLATAAKVTIVDAQRSGGELRVRVRVENLTGHKLPTGYPSRRLWLHVRATSAGATVLESGAVDGVGRIVDGQGAPLTGPRAHLDEITASDQVQIWEAVLVDRDGVATHRAIDARRYGKDDRILPAGWTAGTAAGAATAAVGIGSDPSFIAGQDEISYRVAATAAVHLDIELLYQPLRPETIDAIGATATPASVRFVAQARDRPLTPAVLATATADVP